MKLVIGMPAFNEEKNVKSMIEGIKKLSGTIIVCNDGSNDDTAKIASDLGATVISHHKNLGYGEAIKSIFSKFLDVGGDILVTIDADGQHDPSDIEKIIQPVIEYQADLVIGSRFLNSQVSRIPSYRKLGIDAITKITNIGIEQKITDSQSGFRAYTRKAIEQINLNESGMGISTEIIIKARSKKLKICEVPINISYDGDTSTQNPLLHGTSVMISTIKYTTIGRPLLFFGLPSLIFLALGITFSYFSISFYSEVGRLNTNLTIVSITFIMMGLIFFIAAILLFTIVTLFKEGKNN